MLKKKRLFETCLIVKMYMYINFQQNRVSRSVKTVHTNLLQKIASSINLQLLIVILKKSTFSDMYHRKTYMYINFHQKRVSRSVKTVHTNLFAKKCNLQFEFQEITPFRHESLIIHI